MEKQSKVVFRNVGQMYFPQTRIECHYSLTAEHQWSNKDWIGIFQVGWSSLKDYYTYTWALVPEGYNEGTDVNFYAVFQAFYLPPPSAVEYQFVYVSERGDVCVRSRPFTFGAPKPLDELETMSEDCGEEAEEDELLLVIPRAQVLQSRLEQCLKEQAKLKEVLDLVQHEKETGYLKQDERNKELEQERQAMMEDISELKQKLRQSWEKIKKMEGNHKDVRYTHESMSSDLNNLLAEKTESQQRIKELEDDVKVLTERGYETNSELERMRERIRKMSSQMKYEEEKKKSLQGQYDAAQVEVRGLQDRLQASEHVTEGLRRELSELAAQQGHTHAELHQARLQVAQLTLQLSEENLTLREARANWAQEREALKQSADMDSKKLQDLTSEVQKREEWLQEERMERERLEVGLARERDCNRVLLSDVKREVPELKASLRMAQKQIERQQVEKQDLEDYVRHLEQRYGIESDNYQSSCEEDKNLLERPKTVMKPNDSTHSQEDTTNSDIKQDENRMSVTDEEGKTLNLPEITKPILR